MAKSSETMGQKKLDRLNPISYNTAGFMDEQARLRKSNEDSSENFDSSGDLTDLDSFIILDSDPLGSRDVRAPSTSQNEENYYCFSQSLNQENDSYNYMITPNASARRLGCTKPPHDDCEAQVTSYVDCSNVDNSPRRRVCNEGLPMKDERQETPFFNSNVEEPYPYHYSVTPERAARQAACLSVHDTESWSQKRIYGGEESYVHTYPDSKFDFRVDSSPKYADYERLPPGDMDAEIFHSYAPADCASIQQESKKSFANVTPEMAAKQKVCLSTYDTECWSQKRIYGGEESYVHTYPESKFDLRVDSGPKHADYKRFPRSDMKAEIFHSYAPADCASIQQESKKSFAAKLGSAAKLIGKKHHPSSKVRLPIKQHLSEQKVNRYETTGISNLRPSEDTSTVNKKKKSFLQGIKNMTNRKPVSKASSDESWISESDITDNDVICERGGKSNRHAGTKRYRGIVERLKTKYQNLTMKRDKTDLSREIIAQIQGSNGRFLKKDDDSGLYFVLSKVETTKKVSQALREKKTLKWTEDADE